VITSFFSVSTCLAVNDLDATLPTYLPSNLNWMLVCFDRVVQSSMEHEI
jgi:hypothetical protein